MGDERAEQWLRLKQAAAERLRPLVEPALQEAARRAWGRGWFRSRWLMLRRPEDVSWRAVRYLGTATDEDHRYYELGVTAHLDPAGSLVGFGVDNGVDFIGLHDVSPYGLRRGLDYIRQQRPRLRSYTSLLYDHPLKPFRA
jgi:hypothetical protein